MKPIPVASFDDALPDIRKALKRAYPRGGIRAVGIGYRRRAGLVEPEVVVKVVLTRKRSGLKKSERLPEAVELESNILGNLVRIRVPVDVDQIAKAEPTRYAIELDATHFLTTGSFAVWQKGGERRFGVITAGHGFWKTPGASKRRKVKVKVQQREIEGKVRAVSDLREDKVDVGLVELCSKRTLKQCFPGMIDIWEKVTVPDRANLVAKLGNDQDDLLMPVTFRHPSFAPSDVKGVAYFDAFPVSVKGWGTVTMKDVLECQGPADTFLAGRSGSGLVSKGSPHLALAVQSLCLDPGPRGGELNTRSLGTTFERTALWLEAQMGTPVRPFWNLDEVPVLG